MNAAEGEGGGEHAHVFPVKLLLLLTLKQGLSQAMGHVLPSVHALLDRENHRAIDFEEVVVELGGTAVLLAGQSLKDLEEVNQVRERP